MHSSYTEKSKNHPPNTEDHDVLLLPKGGELQRVLVDKREWVNGVPSRPGGKYVELTQVAHADEPGYRKAIGIARPAGEEKRARGPAFACMPVKPEPASSFYTCYLVDGDNVNFRNDWTEAAWNDAPGSEPETRGEWHQPAFELLVGAPGGVVYYVTADGKSAVQGKPIDLSKESEIWNQLRNGVVAGRVRFEGHPNGPRVVPLLNVTALHR